MRRPAINLTRAERLARVAVGIAGTVAGLLLLSASSGAGHCPLYKRLGYVPPSLRRPA